MDYNRTGGVNYDPMVTHKHTQRRKQMTPYELRFEIFKQAQNLADQEFHTVWQSVDRKNEMDGTSLKYPTYPTYDDIEKLAEKINSFVSSK